MHHITIRTKPQHNRHFNSQNTYSYRFPPHSQQQKALDEFDFLYKIDEPNITKNNKRHSPRMELPPPPPPPTSTAHLPTPSASPSHRSTSSLPQERPYVSQSPEVYHRPVLSMPPVILMGGGGGGNGIVGGGGPGFASLFGSQSVPPSPIVEMPPSPAPSHMMVIEFPDDEDDDDDDENNRGEVHHPGDAMGVRLRDAYQQSHMVHEVRIRFPTYLFIYLRTLYNIYGALRPSIAYRLALFLT